MRRISLITLDILCLAGRPSPKLRLDGGACSLLRTGIPKFPEKQENTGKFLMFRYVFAL